MRGGETRDTLCAAALAAAWDEHEAATAGPEAEGVA